jgi:hypothetical protein
MNNITKTLRSSWNGIAVNGTKYTQYFATEAFWTLRKELTAEVIKSAGFNVYNDATKGWLVTVFGEATGLFESYDDFEQQCFESSREELRQEAMGLKCTDNTIYGLLDEIKYLKNISEMETFMCEECESELTGRIFDYHRELLKS